VTSVSTYLRHYVFLKSETFSAVLTLFSCGRGNNLKPPTGFSAD